MYQAINKQAILSLPPSTIGDCMNKDKQDASKLKFALKELSESINALIDESQGVYGLHLNGSNAPWSSLRGDGRFCEWLAALDDAEALLDELNSQGDVP